MHEFPRPASPSGSAPAQPLRGTVVSAPPMGMSWGAEEVPLATWVVEPAREDGLLAWMDVLGGIAFATFVAMLMTQVGAMLFVQGGWSAAIGWESVWLFAAMICASAMPLGIRHVSSAAAAIKGLVLDWPELAIAAFTLVAFVGEYGLPHGILAPLTMSFAVGAAEEFIFRVLLLGWLVTRVSVERGLLVSSIIFGLVHMQEMSLVGLMSVIPQFSGGVVLGAVYLRTRNIVGPIIAHAFWDLPFFLTLGAGVAGGGTGGGMPSVTSFWEFWLWAGFAVYGFWLVRPGVSVAVRDDEPSAAGCVQHHTG